MANVRVTIDGKSGSVPSGSTVLDAARALGVDIPTLCDHPSIKPIGACRICLVEVEGQRVLQPACTFPVSEGMVVRTDSEAVVDSRKFVLNLLFSERNHFCMFCQMSGSCELQDMAYRYNLDHWTYDRAFPKLPVDASREFFAMDHNRCILCRRCIRVCDELVGNATLGLKHRGAHTMIIADMDVPFGESSCVSCGTCLQVCPTGALMDRASAYMGATKEITRVASHCVACDVGCEVSLVVRQGRVIRVEGAWDGQPNGGLICEVGRFHLLHEKRTRVRKPLVKSNGHWTEAEWDDALQAAAKGLKSANGKVQALLSGYATIEAATALAKGVAGSQALLDGAPVAGDPQPLSVLDEADLFVVVGADLTEDHQVAGFAIKRGVRHRGARLVLIGDGANGLDDWAIRRWALAQADQVLQMAGDAQVPVVLYDAAHVELGRDLAAKLPQAKALALQPAGNTLGLAKAGVAQAFDGNGTSVYYVLACEAAKLPPQAQKALANADFVVVQAAYREPWEEVADVILPSPVWFEKSGTMVNVEGQEKKLTAAVDPRRPGEAQVIERLAALL